MPSTPRADLDLRRELAARLLADQSAAPIGHLVAIAIAASFLWGLAPHGLVLTWTGAVLFAAAARAGVWWMGRHHPSVEVVESAVRVAVAAVALAWGLGAAILAQYIPPEYVALVLLVLGGIVATASATLAADSIAFHLFLFGVLGPMPIAILWSAQGRFAWTASLLVAAFAGFTAMLYRQSHRALVEQLRGVILLRRRDVERHQERGFQDALFASVPNALVVLDRDGRGIALNAAFQALFGYAPNEVVGRPVVDLIVPEQDREAALTLLHRALAGETVVAEVERRCKGGRLVTVQLSAARVTSVDQGTTLFLYTDLSAIRAAQEALRATQQRLEQVTASSTAVIYATRVDGQNFIPSWVSENLARITGFDVAEALDPNWWSSQIHPEDRDRVFAEVSQLMANDRLVTEYRFRPKKGGYRWIHDESRLVRDSAGRPQEVFGAWLDITDRKQAEWAMHEARELAERSARSRAAFLANMSHEIRTPMNAILGLTELVLDTDLSAYQRRSLGLVRSAGESLLTLLNDVLDFSKIEAEHLTLEAVAFDLRYLLESTASLLAVKTSDRPVELAADIGADIPPRVRGDPTRLRQVLTNLVGNAIKFTSEGEVVLSAVGTNLPDGNVRVAFTVRDTGIGIPQEQLESIFEEFQQADASMTRRYGGTGLGLTIARRLVGLMGGELAVKSEVGRGSEFSFVLNFPVDLEAVAAAPSPSQLAGQRLLVVDDNATNRRVIREMLESVGVRVEEANGADRALEAIRWARDRGESFGLAVLDAQMPGRDGFELAGAIRSDPLLAGIKLLMLTSAGQRGDTQRCRELGLHGYLTKPASRSDLLEMITALLNPAADHSGAEVMTRHSIAELRRRLRILLAEDNPVNQEVAATMLRKRGHKVEVVANGREAVEALVAQPYDVILMDIQMPEMDGFAATKAIRAGKVRPDIPIVALTAHALTGEKERCLANGMNGYVPKPFRPLDLFLAVESFEDVILADEPAQVTPAPSMDVDGFRRMMREAGAEDSVDGILDLFVQSVPERLAALSAACSVGDATAIGSAAHAFKSPSGSIGALGLAGLLQDIELAARAGEVERARAQLETVEKEAAAVLRYLQGLRGGKTDSAGEQS